MRDSNVILCSLLFLVLAACLALFMGCDVEGDDDDDDNPAGSIVGDVVDAFTGVYLGDANVEALLSKDRTETAITNEDGVFEMNGIPSASKLRLSFQKEGYASRYVSVNTKDARHDGQITSVHVMMVPASSVLELMVTHVGKACNNVDVWSLPTSYWYDPIAGNTGDSGLATYFLGDEQSYLLSAEAQDLNGDGVLDTQAGWTPVSMIQQYIRMNLELPAMGEDDFRLLSYGIGGWDVFLAFSQPIYTFELVDIEIQDNDGSGEVKLYTPQIIETITGHQVICYLNIREGDLTAGDIVWLELKVQSFETGDMWHGEVEIEVPDEYGSGDDDDDVDDDDDDDDDNDDDVVNSNPVLSDGYWAPEEWTWDLSCAYLPCTGLLWFVCDEDDDLLGGQVWVYIAGTVEPFFMFDIFWSDLLDGTEDVTDCDNPVQKGIGVLMDMSGMPGVWELCVDIEATDGSGNWSNMLENLCTQFIVPYKN